jgi:hypothetical protein
MAGNVTFVNVNTTTPVSILATGWGGDIVIQEDKASSAGAYPKSDYIVYHVQKDGTIGTNGRTVTAGGQYTFKKSMGYQQIFGPGDIVGFVKASTLAFTLAVDEGGA